MQKNNWIKRSNVSPNLNIVRNLRSDINREILHQFVCLNEKGFACSDSMANSKTISGVSDNAFEQQILINPMWINFQKDLKIYSAVTVCQTELGIFVKPVAFLENKNGNLFVYDSQTPYRSFTEAKTEIYTLQNKIQESVLTCENSGFYLDGFFYKNGDHFSIEEYVDNTDIGKTIADLAVLKTKRIASFWNYPSNEQEIYEKSMELPFDEDIHLDLYWRTDIEVYNKYVDKMLNMTMNISLKECAAFMCESMLDSICRLENFIIMSLHNYKHHKEE